MDLTLYKTGQWIRHLGKYKKICRLLLCKLAFAGRENKYFCRIKCKTKFNNDKGKKRRELAKRFTNATLKANTLFLDLIENWDEINYVAASDLLDKGYTKFAPGRDAKYDKYHGEWWCIGSFAHRKVENKKGFFEFISVENLK